MAQSDKDDLISLIEDDGAISEIPTALPLLPVRDVVVFCVPIKDEAVCTSCFINQYSC